MKNKRFTQWVAVATAAAAAGLVVADDRHFLQSGRAEPNLIFILDTSSTMAAGIESVGTIWPGCDPAELVLDTNDDGVPDAPDPARCKNGAIGSAGQLPGAGDDPYSRMGIAKRVLRDFLQDVELANVAFAGYAQAPPADGMGITQKHWVYEALAQDRFRMVEPGYAFRFGYNQKLPSTYLDVPADVYKKKLIGYQLYFNPAETEVTDRYGPVRGYDTGIREILSDSSERPLAYDLMPIYFGNCFWDTNHPVAPEVVCRDGVFPFYDSGIRIDNDIDPAVWYYGEFSAGEDDYPGCNPEDDIWDRNDDGIPDRDACVNTWYEDIGPGVTRHFQRRVRLEVPETFNSNPNHFIEIDADGARTGNEQIPDGGAEDYDQDTHSDPDLDGDTANDWMLYVNSVEERRQIDCVPSGSLDPWTATPTKTAEEICILSITNFTATYDTDQHYARIDNDTPYNARIVSTYYDWGANRPANNFVEDMAICTDSPPNDKCDADEYYWDDNTGVANGTFPYNGTGMWARPLDVAWDENLATPGFVGMAKDPIIPGGGTYFRHWWSDVGGTDNGWAGIYTLCMEFLLINGGYPDSNGDPTDLLCPEVCASINATPTPVPPPTETWTPAPPGPTSTPWWAPTATPSGPVPTSPPLSTRTPTPVPTATPTFTPAPPTATPTPPPVGTAVG